MKQNLKARKPVLSCIVLVLHFTSYCQDTSSIRTIEIDPRQYINVLYNKNAAHGKLDTIWNWENRKNIPNQKFNFIDIDGQIKIIFDKRSLISNLDFFGSMSLEAEISGSNGTRQIEVNPYSEIGVQRKTIGVKSDPPYEVANKLLNILKELTDAEEKYGKINGQYYTFQMRQAALDFKRQTGILVNECSDGKTSILDLRSGIISVIKEFLAKVNLDLKIDYKELSGTNDKNILCNLIKSNKTLIYTDFEKRILEPFVENYVNALDYLNDKSPLVIDYLNSFEKSGSESFKALLALTNKDVVNYRGLKDKLINQQEYLANIKVDNNDNVDQKDSVLLANHEVILKSLKILNELSRFKGSRIEKIILNFGKLTDKYKNNFKNINSYTSDYKQTFVDLINDYGDSIAAIIAKRAGELIYQKLVFATIDLGRCGAKSGEAINLYLTWILDSNDSLGNSPRLQIGKYYLRETGPKVEIADMFALVNRVRPSTSIDTAHTSPSNFKGSGGATLMWSYQKQDKGLKILKTKNDPNSYYTKKRNQLLNFLEPSFGVNVSYLDFNTAKDVEIGVGLQVGLFRNKIFFGYGANLHLLFPKDAPYYFFIGFSFAKIQDLFKNSNNILSATQ